MFRQVYLHKTCQAIDLMVSEALVRANPVYHFEEVIFKPELYMKYMHDDLLAVIAKSKNPVLKDSAALLQRIHVRDLYKCVGEASIHKENRSKITS